VSLQLIDFGVSIDTKFFPKNYTFNYVHHDEYYQQEHRRVCGNAFELSDARHCGSSARHGYHSCRHKAGQLSATEAVSTSSQLL